MIAFAFKAVVVVAIVTVAAAILFRYAFLALFPAIILWAALKVNR